MKIKVINGPNINLLGLREKNIYGERTYEDLLSEINKWSIEEDIFVSTYQSNHEGDLIDSIQRAYFEGFDGIVINPGAYTHTSIGIRDALLAINLPFVEVHISDVSNREDFRKFSYLSDICDMRVVNKGIGGYIEGLNFLKDFN